VKALGSETAVVYPVVGATTDRDDPALGGPDLDAAPKGAEDADRVHPVISLGDRSVVDADGP
jgi:hypothetical protein